MHKGTPKRPAIVPHGARWVAPLWQYGTVDQKGAAQGLWCGWKKNGGLAYVAHFRDDAVEGASLEFHPDGSLFRRATYQRGGLIGVEEFFAPLKKSDEPFPATKPIARVVVDHSAKPPQKRFFLLDGAECNEQGTPLSALVQDGPFLIREAEAFFKQGLPVYLKHRIKVAPSAAARAKAAPQPGLTRSISALWGLKPKPAFKLALGLLERAKLPRHLGDFGPEPVASLAALSDGATVESIVTRGQRSVGALPISALFAGLVPIATDAGGDVFTLSVFDDELTHVYSCGSEDRDLLVESDDFATFVVWSAAEEASAAGMISARARAHLARLFSGHVRATELGDARWLRAAFDSKETKAGERWRRSGWLVALLAGKPIDLVLAAFEEEDARPLDRALFARRSSLATLAPPDVLYILFRAWLSGAPDLGTLLDAADKSKASLVVSGSSLVRALSTGRNRLGALKDIRASIRPLARLFTSP